MRPVELSIKPRTKRLFLLMLFWSLWNTSWVCAQGIEAKHLETETSGAELYFTNVVLVNQHDQNQRLYQDLIKDKVVVINSFFTSCQESCPIGMKILAGVQSLFPDNMGRDLYMISISLDPEIDTPPRLKVYADDLNIGPGWQLLTGDRASVDFALKKLGNYVEEKTAHSNIVIIGNESTGLWKKAFVHAGPEALAKVVASVLNDTGESTP